MKHKLILLLFFLSAANSAFADQVLNFTLTGGSQTLSFTLPTNPVEVNEGDDFYATNVSFMLGNTSGVASEVAFYDIAVGGGFAFGDASGNILDNLAFTGNQVFMNTTSMPSFGGGPYNLTSYFGDPTPLELQEFTSQPTSPAVTPEPSSGVLLAIGILALGLFSYRVVPGTAQTSPSLFRSRVSRNRPLPCSSAHGH